MKKTDIILFSLLSIIFSKLSAQELNIDQWWVTFGLGNAFEGFGISPKGINMSGNINIHIGNYYYQIGLDDSGIPIYSDKTMGSINFDFGKVFNKEYYILSGFGGLGIMNYAYSDSNFKVQNRPTIGINLNANFILKPRMFAALNKFAVLLKKKGERMFKTKTIHRGMFTERNSLTLLMNSLKSEQNLGHKVELCSPDKSRVKISEFTFSGVLLTNLSLNNGRYH